MIAIPAYQDNLINGQPDIKFFIRAGESIVPTGGNVEDMEENMVIEEATITETKKPKRKLSAWNRYTKKKANKIFFKSGKNKGKLNFKAMSAAFKKSRRKK